MLFCKPRQRLVLGVNTEAELFSLIDYQCIISADRVLWQFICAPFPDFEHVTEQLYNLNIESKCQIVVPQGVFLPFL